MPNTTPTRISGTPPSIKDQGVYQDIAKFRRQQTLTPDQLDPTVNSATRRRLYKTGKPTTAAGYRRVGTQP